MEGIRANSALSPETEDRLEEAANRQFEERYRQHFPRLREHFRSLYGHRDDLDDQLAAVTETLRSKWEARPQGIRTADLHRLEQPDWFLSQQWVGMMLYVDLFNGDLRGFIERLDYLQELGINYVHLMPVLRSPTDHNDGGYAVSDYRSIDQRLGTLEDLKEVTRELRDRNMILMLDIVINHTSDEHEWAQRARSGDKTYQDYYYFFEDRLIPDEFERSLPEVFPETSPGNFTHIEELDKWVMTVFNSFQWDLNYTNPRVFVEMLDNLLTLSNWGADVLRLDALAFMWKRLGTASQNLDEAHLLVQTFKTCLQIAAPGSLFLAEAIVAPKEIIRYFGQPTGSFSNECDLAYNATLMTLLWDSVATKNNKLLRVSLDNVPQKPEATSWITYLRCHDDIGLGYEDMHAAWAGYDPRSHRRFIQDYLTGKIDWSKSRGLPFMEDPANGSLRVSGSLASLVGLEKALDQQDAPQIQQCIDHIIMLHAVILSFGGIPMLYMGDELGLLNDYDFREDRAKQGDNRWVHRPKMDWQRARQAQEGQSVEGQIFLVIKELIKARKQVQEFKDDNNTYLIDCGNQHILAFGRYDDKGRIICVFNLNDHEEWFSVEHLRREGLDTDNGLVDKANGFAVDQPYKQVKMSPFQFHWLAENKRPRRR